MMKLCRQALHTCYVGNRRRTVVRVRSGHVQNATCAALNSIRLRGHGRRGKLLWSGQKWYSERDLTSFPHLIRS